ncbi:hypothetical protein JRQ81_013566 [Phrynocephalus forsythii]|uniref:Uncharacterized protein n=1 Tax=Phrynocephalus forsythii TaxID=171643 RepID=A0A9Q1B4V6_9SAUR|nr:hypothetical protein JRQ81_013566 [Phrynocephalus forsythii]
MAQFQALMLASQEKITKDIAEIKQEIQQINIEMKGIRDEATQAKHMALKNTEQTTQLKNLTAELSDRMRRANLIIYGISEDIDQRNLEW